MCLDFDKNEKIKIQKTELKKAEEKKKRNKKRIIGVRAHNEYIQIEESS